jgi:hypothetical protein
MENFVNRTTVANVADWEDNIAFDHASNTTISASTPLPSIRIATVPQLGYASNDSSDERQRSQFPCTFDDTTQRFSFLSVTPTATWTTDYAALDNSRGLPDTCCLIVCGVGWLRIVEHSL